MFYTKLINGHQDILNPMFIIYFGMPTAYTNNRTKSYSY